MSPSSADVAYSEAEWTAAAGHRPLASLADEDLALLHRHWMWCNQVRELFDGTFADEPPTGPAMLASRGFGLMFIWYGLLWAVVEACIEPRGGRAVDIRGRFRQDIDHFSDTLRQCRNAVLHVPRSGQYVDHRLENFVAAPGSALAMRRISLGFGRLFLEELTHRQHPAPDPVAPAG